MNTTTEETTFHPDNPVTLTEHIEVITTREESAPEATTRRTRKEMAIATLLVGTATLTTLAILTATILAVTLT